MKNILFKFISAAICAVAFNACGAEVNAALSEIPEEKLTEMTMQANDIAFSFYKQKAANKDKNFFFSPYSMRSAFAMAREGAKGDTAEEMNKVFSFPSDNAEMRLAMQAMGEAVSQAAKGSKFSDANSFWANKKYKFLNEYTSSLKKNYKAAAENVDFANDTEGARKKINSWTSSKTNGIIKELFAEGSLDPLTRLVLVNAVYFKGTWKEAFGKNATFEADFYLNSGEKSKADLMRHEDETHFPYAQKENAQFLAMPYKNGGDSSGTGLEMMVILPADKKSFEKTEKELSSSYIAEVRKEMSREQVRVFLPKFKFSSTHELNDDLKAMGMPLAFSDKADFSGMTGDNELKIGTAIQKAFIDVSEEGTEAAAATAVAMTLKAVAIARPSYIFRADKPFIFLIRDVKTGLILFMGKVENPKAA